MRYQALIYSCGAAAILNAARCFSKTIMEKTARAIAETTPDGTSDDGILNALTTLKLEGEVFNYSIASLATTRVRMELHTYGNPIIICTQNSTHWVTLVGLTDRLNRFILIDSANTKRNMKENGCHILTENELKATWQTRNGEFFGIVVHKRGRR